MVVLLAGLLPAAGIVLSWSIALAVSVVLANVYLFGRVLAGRASMPVTEDLTIGGLTRFLAPDYLASLFQTFTTAGLPLLVVASAGAAQNAYFWVAWNVAYALYLVSTNMGYSMVVESAKDQGAVATNLFRVVRRLLPVLVGAVALLVVGAPDILRLFGAPYASHGATVLRILALSAIPNLLTCSVSNVARARRRTRVSLCISASLCGIVVGLSVALLPSMGIEGVALAWLIGQFVVSAALLVSYRTWLPDRARHPQPTWSVTARQPLRCWSTGLVGGPERPHLSALERVVPSATAALESLGVHRSLGQVRLQLLPTVNDVTAALMVSADDPVGVLKLGSASTGRRKLYLEHIALRSLRDEFAGVGIRHLLPASCYLQHPGGPFLVQSWLAGSGALRRADALRVELRRRLEGASVSVGRTHGDLWLGNLLYASPDQLAGIVDWGGSYLGPVGVDACHLGLVTWAMSSGRTLGAVVGRCLRAGGWSRLVAGALTLDRRLLGDPALDERLVVMLTWLQHVSTVIAKNRRERSSPVWLMTNVERVLWEHSRSGRRRA